MEMLLPDVKKFRKDSKVLIFVEVSRCRYLDRRKYRAVAESDIISDIRIKFYPISDIHLFIVKH
jgi:hypothetical protein